MAEQMILQFQSLLKLAVKVKEAYLLAAHPEPVGTSHHALTKTSTVSFSKLSASTSAC